MKAGDRVKTDRRDAEKLARCYRSGDLTAVSEKQMADLREHGKQFSDGRYELFKSSVKYDGDVGREQHNYPTTLELPA